VLPILLFLVAGGGDLARAYFVGIQMSDGARESALYIAANGPYLTQGSSTASSEYAAELPSSGTYTGCPTAGGAEGPAVDAGCQAFSGSFLACPSNDIKWTFAPATLPTQPGTPTSDSFTVTVTAVCKLSMVLALVAPSVSIKSTSTAYVVQP